MIYILAGCRTTGGGRRQHYITAGTHACTTPEDQLLTLGPLGDEVDALVARCGPHANRLALNRTVLVRVLVSKVVGLLYQRTDGQAGGEPIAPQSRPAYTHHHVILHPF